MSRPKTRSKIKVELMSVPRISAMGISNLETKDYYNFIQTHDMPERYPVVNKIRFAMIEHDEKNNEIYEQLKKVGIHRRRISDTLSGKKPERIVIEELCKFLDIPLKESLFDHIANYDFEQKEIGHKVGARSKKDKQIFLEAFRESWSDETVNQYLCELEENDIEWEDDDTVCRIEDERKRALFKKLYDIYEDYPNMISAFCDQFVYENDQVKDNLILQL